MCSIILNRKEKLSLHTLLKARGIGRSLKTGFLTIPIVVFFDGNGNGDYNHGDGDDECEQHFHLPESIWIEHRLMVFIDWTLISDSY